MLGLGSDRKVLGIYFQRRLLLAGAHAARARHPCRLRPAQIRNRETLGARARGTARHGDDGLMRMSRLVVQAVIASSVPAVWPTLLDKSAADQGDSGLGVSHFLPRSQRVARMRARRQAPRRS